jgi:hypothetical protein
MNYKNKYGFFQKWTQQEINYLKRNYGKIKVKEISKSLKRKRKSILDKAYLLDLKSDLTHKGYKTPQNIKKRISLGLKRNYRKNPKIKKIIGLSVKKRWANPKYMKKMKIIRKRNWKKNPNYKLINSRLKKPILNSKKLTSELAYIIGVILGDGCLKNYKYKKSSFYLICLGVKNKEFALKFKNYLEKWSGLRVKINIVNSKTFKQGFYYRVILYSKIIFNILQNYIKELNKNILNSQKKYQIAFLEGLYDSEGSVSFNYYKGYANKVISFCNTNKTIIDLVQNILNNYKIQTHLIQEKLNSGKKCYYIKIYKQENFIKFYNLINFSIRYKQNKLEKISNSKLYPNNLNFRCF